MGADAGHSMLATVAIASLPSIVHAADLGGGYEQRGSYIHVSLYYAPYYYDYAPLEAYYVSLRMLITQRIATTTLALTSPSYVPSLLGIMPIWVRAIGGERDAKAAVVL
jgi:hypothetical protein